MCSKRSRAFLIGHIFRKNCLLKHFIKRQIVGRIQVKGRRGRRGKQLLNDFKENGEYWKLKRKHYMVLTGELALVQAIDLMLRQTRE